MLSDFALPASFGGVTRSAKSIAGLSYTHARPTGADLGRLTRHLGHYGPRCLDSISKQRIASSWQRTVEILLDSRSSARQSLDPALIQTTGLSRDGLEAALAILLEGCQGDSVGSMASRARKARDRTPVLVFLAGNLPGLALQALLPPLLLGRPVLLKSSSREPFFAPQLARQLVLEQPELEDALAVLSWPGGELELESELLRDSSRVVAFGDQSTLDELGRRARGRVIGFGPKISLAVVARDVDLEKVSVGLAEDIALFDQRGCLSVHAIYTTAEAERLADSLAAALSRIHTRWPPGPLDPALAASVQQLRAEADLRGLYRPHQALSEGTVIVESRAELRPSPGLRTVRVHPLSDLATLDESLKPFAGRLQGATLAGASAHGLEPRLRALGVSKCSAPGDLQRTDFSWRNGGMDPLEVYGESDPGKEPKQAQPPPYKR